MVRLFGCFTSASTVAERLQGSTYLFLCGPTCHSPVLFLFGLIASALQSVLLLLVWSRAEANMFYEFYSHGLVPIHANATASNGTHANATDMGNLLKYRFPSVEVWKQLGRTGAPGEGIAAAGAAGGANFEPQVDYSAGIERYNVMLQYSAEHAWLPTFLTHPDLQVCAIHAW
jgi:hypothetical protein